MSLHKHPPSQLLAEGRRLICNPLCKEPPAALPWGAASTGIVPSLPHACLTPCLPRSGFPAEVDKAGSGGRAPVLELVGPACRRVAAASPCKPSPREEIQSNGSCWGARVHAFGKGGSSSAPKAWHLPGSSSSRSGSARDQGTTHIVGLTCCLLFPVRKGRA